MQNNQAWQAAWDEYRSELSANIHSAEFEYERGHACLMDQINSGTAVSKAQLQAQYQLGLRIRAAWVAYHHACDVMWHSND